MKVGTTTTFERTFDLLEQGDLNWSVSKEPLYTQDGKETESFGLYRSDNQKWLSTVGNQYQPLQNSTLVETLVDASESLGFTEIRTGHLQSSRKVFVQIALEDDFVGKSGIKRMLTALNSHDGTTAVGFGSTNTVVVCQNTFHMAYKDLRKIRHSMSAEERVREAMLELKMSLTNDENLMRKFKKMAEIPVTKSAIEKIMERCFEIDINDKSEKNTRSLNRAESIAQAIEKEFDLEGLTMWGLFNGVTRYTNHVRKYANEEDKMSSLMVSNGQAYRTNLVAFDEVMKWVDKHTEKSMFVIG
jgi:phage/plasmid-like protein (TIGR03299 family)